MNPFHKLNSVSQLVPHCHTQNGLEPTKRILVSGPPTPSAPKPAEGNFQCFQFIANAPGVENAFDDRFKAIPP